MQIENCQAEIAEILNKYGCSLEVETVVQTSDSMIVLRNANISSRIRISPLQPQQEEAQIELKGEAS